ncbi:hypothetical protein BH708_02610 [Brachybacterium sp. P6-10-X1]|uniref:restriction endonuclease subunit S n=1 Tax=Brachybacterium sp. P6-10-X1 TaxID=1903186 RepID=UPI000971B56B|nr:restriction endonuclease subunit S [Brachybacterium sp. P6-10-X1]APX31790.1 hypothetical protein BH708_02610 [Brachybacterium sp. P6-10-X1]
MTSAIPIKRLASVTLGKMVQPGSKAASDIYAPYLRAAHVQPQGKVIELPDQRMWFSRFELRALDLRQGDVVVVEGGAGYGRSAVLRDDLPGWGFQNSIVRLRPAVGVADGRYLDYALQDALTDGRIDLVTSTATLPHFTADKVSKFEVPSPALDEQRAIADYLDQETAQIDALVAKQEELIGLLKERRDAAWALGLSRAVEELRPIPLRRVITSIVDGPFGSSLTSAHYSDSGTRVIRLGNIGTNSFRTQDEAYIPDSYAEQLAGHDARPGDVVIAGLGDETWPLGRAAVVPDLGPAIVKADCFRVRPASGVSGEYLAWALSAPQTRSQVALLARGSTRKRINTSVARAIEIPVPSLERQESILKATEGVLYRIDTLITKAGEHIALAKERRAALITAAVTGQFDVRTARKAE